MIIQSGKGAKRIDSIKEKKAKLNQDSTRKTHAHLKRGRERKKERETEDEREDEREKDRG